ncbi:hypothetical protein EVA_04107 [gut metagenome]|uniref:Uncharacterized protein n=1 Tax=gut metagenome TaxID=749906 RepID=J9H2L0_9ZZZZ
MERRSLLDVPHQQSLKSSYMIHRIFEYLSDRSRIRSTFQRLKIFLVFPFRLLSRRQFH